MKTSSKTGFAQIFSCTLPKMGGSKIWGSPSFAPLTRTPPLTKLQRISSSWNNYVVLTFKGEKKIYPFLELVEDKPHLLSPASEVCHAWRTSKPPQAVLLWKISKIKQSLVE